jgi:hypothetical protein
MSRTLRAAQAGVVGALAYLAAQEVDRRIVNPRSDDLILLGGMVTSHERAWRPLGLAMHVLAGASFGLVFEHVVAARLPGPYWLRGVLLGQLENAALWPLVLLLDRHHVAVRRGRLAPMNRPVYFVQAVWRHLALGAVLGALLQPPTSERRTAKRSGQRP